MVEIKNSSSTNGPTPESEQWVSEWAIKFNSLSWDGGSWGPYNPYKQWSYCSLALSHWYTVTDTNVRFRNNTLKLIYA